MTLCISGFDPMSFEKVQGHWKENCKIWPGQYLSFGETMKVHTSHKDCF